MDINEREINLKLLLFSLCKKWKQIIFCALIGVVILGTYGYHKGKVVKKIDANELLQKEADLARQQDYLNNSVLMKYSNTDFWRHSIQIDISVKDENIAKIMQVFESYSNAIKSEGFDSFIANEIGENPNYIYEIVNLTNINENRTVYVIRDDSCGTRTLSFMVMALGPDVQYTSKIVLTIKKYIEQQGKTISSSICPHTINIFNIGAVSASIDKGKKAKIEKNVKSLRAEINSFKGNNSKSYKKWGLIGLVLGVLGAVGLYTLLFVLSDKLHESEEIESIFGIETWNVKQISNKKLKEILIATILANKDKYNTVLATGTSVSDNIKEIMEECNKEIGEDVIAIFEDIVINPDAIKALVKTKAVLLLETAEKSKMTDIYREVKYIKQANVPIIGCIVDIA